MGKPNRKIPNPNRCTWHVTIRVCIPSLLSWDCKELCFPQTLRCVPQTPSRLSACRGPRCWGRPRSPPRPASPGVFPSPWRPQLQDPDVQLCTQQVAKAPGAVSVGGEESCAVFKVDVAVSKETGKSPDAGIRLVRKICS